MAVSMKGMANKRIICMAYVRIFGVMVWAFAFGIPRHYER